ncbi:MAG: hypothetical protein HRT88_08175 [Lentisphaeraceae bacterium]|nr:hypothetical protein [Lentisphaeraceae bacterium]
MKNLCVILLALIFLNSCSTKKKVIPKHPDYSTSDDFSVASNFDYFTANKNGIEGIKRLKEELKSHCPQLNFSKKGKSLTVTFPMFTSKSPLHRWSWLEIRDFDGTTIFKDFPLSTKSIKPFSCTVKTASHFEELVRVRAYCQVHGEFVEYVKVPNFTTKSLIDK